MWSTAFPLIERILNLYGHHCSIMDGSTSDEVKNQIIEEFKSPGPHKDSKGRPAWLLLMSNVGTVGINLARASWLYLGVGATMIDYYVL